MDRQSYEHAGAPPPRPEVPDGLPLAWSVPPPSSPAGSVGPPPWPVWAPLVGFLGAFLVILMADVVFTIIVELTGGERVGNAAVNLAVLFVQNAAFVGASVALARLFAPDRSAAADLGLRRTPVWGAIGWMAVVAVSVFCFVLIWTLLVGAPDQEDVAEEIGAKGSTVALAGLGVMVMVGAAIGEEVFFRGFLFGALRRRIGILGGAGVTGVLFGAIHAFNTEINGLVVLAFLGFMLCLLYVWTKSLIPCIVLHAINNALAFGVLVDREAEIPLFMAAATTVVLALTLPLTRRR